MMYLARRVFFFFNDTATTEIYTLSLHDALPISAPPRRLRGRGCRAAARRRAQVRPGLRRRGRCTRARPGPDRDVPRSEEHTSELQSRQYLVCRLLLEKKNTQPARLPSPSSTPHT